MDGGLDESCPEMGVTRLRRNGFCFYILRLIIEFCNSMGEASGAVEQEAHRTIARFLLPWRAVRPLFFPPSLCYDSHQGVASLFPRFAAGDGWTIRSPRRRVPGRFLE
jgi:hypothetical protein